VYTVILVIDFARYSRFNSNIRRILSEGYYDLEPSTNEQENISSVIEGIYKAHSKEISSINVDTLNRQHFLSQWIHNMKTPVSVIGLILQKIRMEETLKEDQLNDIEEENNRLHNGLEQILSIIRMEEFFRDYEPEVVDLMSLLKDLINSKKSQFIYNNVYPKLNSDYKNAMIITDSKWNRFMLEQVINNAIKYSDAKDDKKYVTFTIVKEGKNTHLTIEDQGVGIPEHDLPRVFNPFFTGENGRNFNNSTGIGLYITATVAEKLGHGIDIASKVDEGTKFTISYVTKL
jgi:signal transduction histidine kinase